MDKNPKDYLQSFKGVYAAALTPFHDDFNCNYEAFADHCKDVIHRGCNGVVLFGSSGEGPSFSVSEHFHLLRKIISLGVDPRKIIMGISCCAIEDTVKLATEAMDQHCMAVMILPPFYYKNVNETGTIQFYREVIQRIDRPNLKVILYHIPKYSGVPITLETIRVLREEFPNSVIGIKDSDGNIAYTKEVISTFSNFNVFVGNETHISEAVQFGGAGGISGVANAYPELISSLYKYGIDPKAQNNNEIVQSIAQAIKSYPVFPAIKKVVENQKGPAWNILRPPLTPLDAEQSIRLIKTLNQLVIS
jgi:4-hydroxy-tetrahydrodipicolinate synthase